MKPPTIRLALSILGLAVLAGAFLPERAAAFDYDALCQRARQTAAAPYVPPPARVPAWLLRFNYDQYRDIRFIPAKSWWSGSDSLFRLQFFHPGFIFNRTVQISELGPDGTPAPIPFSSSLFNYGRNRVGLLPPSMGFAGFRMLYPLNTNIGNDEIGAFQGASYFRLLCRGSVYGLSARGLAIDTAEPTGEEFPDFEDYWVQRPAAGVRTITVLALLDGPSAAGAYRFVISPGTDTVARVTATIYCRRNPKVLGLAPLTSMFWHGKNTSAAYDDFRPEVHDSDGLQIETGKGEWIWRPLTDPSWIRVSSFSDESPRGFGLMQRERRFDSYQDIESAYQLRPSAWVQPVGDWGQGSVRLVELPAPDESYDNIVAFWTPDRLPPPGRPIRLTYDLHWTLDGPRPPAGAAIATRLGRTRTQETDWQRFVVDFDGADLRAFPAGASIEPVVTVGSGAKLMNATAEKNPYNGTWRVAFGIRPDNSGRPVELRCYLCAPHRVLTETWSYLWQPNESDRR